MPTEKKEQIFSVKISEFELNMIISKLMELPAGQVYNFLRKLETETIKQRALPEDQKEYTEIKPLDS